MPKIVYQIYGEKGGDATVRNSIQTIGDQYCFHGISMMMLYLGQFMDDGGTDDAESWSVGEKSVVMETRSMRFLIDIICGLPCSMLDI